MYWAKLVINDFRRPAHAKLTFLPGLNILASLVQASWSGSSHSSVNLFSCTPVAKRVMLNTKCPYTRKQIADIESNREHIIPDALGGPNGLALNADAKSNSAFGAGVDGRLINSPLMAIKASQAKVQTRNGPVTVKLQGTLVSDNSSTDIRISENGEATFRSRIPVIKDPITGAVVGVRGFGNDAQEQVEALRAGNAKKGRVVEAGESVARDSTTQVRIDHNLAETDQGLAKIAYLTAVWTLGDSFIDTEPAEAFRKLIFGEATREAITASGVSVQVEKSAEEPWIPLSPNEHHLICATLNGMLVVSVSLFCDKLFTRKFVVPMTLADVKKNATRVILVNATAKTYEEKTFYPAP